MIAGPYSSGGADDVTRAQNLAAMNAAALNIFDKGHIPIIEVNMALPVIGAAGPDRFDEIMMPLSLALADGCDAILCIGDVSAGADEEVERMRAAGKPVYFALDEISEDV